MTRQQEQQHDRREMLRRSIRYMALGGIGIGSGTLIVRAARCPGDDGSHRSLPCRECGSLARCELPSALRARESHRGS
ncbi:MAG: hypothetical protein V3R99_13300 [Thermoguttaceae bacterium]